MKKIVIMLGISGAGKSTYISHESRNEETMGLKTKTISPDFERKRISGNVSDQSVSKEAFEACFSNLKNYVSNSKVDVIYWDATNLSLHSLNDIYNVIKEYCTDEFKIKVVCLDTSRDWKLCQSRVENDIANGKDRSDSTGKRDDGKYIIESMSERYCSLMNSHAVENWCKEKGAELKVLK